MKNICRDKSKLNLSIDIFMFLLLMPIAGIGLLIKYVLIPGIQRNLIYGSNIDLTFWGLTRHQWGTIHLILSVTFLTLLILHILLHWKMIICILKKMIPNKYLRIGLLGFLAVFSLIVLFSPLLIKPELNDKELLHRNRDIKNSGSSDYIEQKSYEDTTLNSSNKTNKSQHEPENKHHNSVNEEYEVYGSQTLQYVADKYNVPAEVIAADLKIPITLTGEKLGRLKKQYSFTMDDVKASIAAHKKR